MTFLPIVERELRVTARLAATFRNRWLSVGLVTLVVIVMLVFGVFCCLTIPILFIIPIIWSGVCSSKLYSRLREKESSNLIVASPLATGLVPAAEAKK